MACLAQTQLMGEEREEVEQYLLNQEFVGESCLYTCYTNEDMLDDLINALKTDKFYEKGTILSKVWPFKNHNFFQNLIANTYHLKACQKY
jgi:hypothetical protein